MNHFEMFQLLALLGLRIRYWIIIIIVIVVLLIVAYMVRGRT
jgi:hypothetical protein